MRSAKIIMTLYVRWKKFKELDDGSGDKYIRIKMPFSSLMMELFEISDITKLIKRMLAHIKAQTENPKFLESGFTLDKIMQLFIIFHRLVLTRGSSYTELPGWIKSKKAVINPQSKDEECFKCAVTGALHHEDIKDPPERINLLKLYEKQYNWKGHEFLVSVKKIDKFDKKQPWHSSKRVVQ